MWLATDNVGAICRLQSEALEVNALFILWMGDRTLTVSAWGIGWEGTGQLVTSGER